MEQYHIATKPIYQLSDSNLQIAYQKYQAILGLQKQIQEDTKTVWKGKTFSIEDIYLCYTTKATFYRWTNAFADVKNYPLMELYLMKSPLTPEELKDENFLDSFKPEVESLWGEWKKVFSFADLGKWFKDAKEEQRRKEARRIEKIEKKKAKELKEKSKKNL